MRAANVRMILAKYGIVPSKTRGQNFLLDENTVRKEVEAASITEDDVVLEVGPGLGILTKELASRAGKVIAVEVEEAFVRMLKEELKDYDNVEIIAGDALRMDFPRFNKFVSNIPYSISSPLLFKLMEYDFDKAVMILQEEFAWRLLAEPGLKDYSRLSVMVQIRCDVTQLFRVPKQLFFPSPKVDSMAVMLEPREDAPEIKDFELFDTVVRAIFNQRRKKFRNVLGPIAKKLSITKEELENIIISIDEELLDMRGEMLFPDEMVEFSNRLWELTNGD